jgi:hypothetical protein
VRASAAVPTSVHEWFGSMVATVFSVADAEDVYARFREWQTYL